MVTGLRETSLDGAYCLILEFDSPLVPLDKWLEKQEKMTKYFAPNVHVKITQPDEDKIELELITINHSN